MREIGERNQIVAGLLVHRRARGDLQDEIAAVMSGAIRSLTVLAALGAELRMEAVGDERVLVETRDEVDRTAVSAVAAVRSAPRDALLAAKAQAAVAAAARFDLDVDLVDEHGGNLQIW